MKVFLEMWEFERTPPKVMCKPIFVVSLGEKAGLNLVTPRVEQSTGMVCPIALLLQSQFGYYRRYFDDNMLLLERAELTNPTNIKNRDVRQLWDHFRYTLETLWPPL